MSKETIFDDMKDWTHEHSHNGLSAVVNNSLTGRPEVVTDHRLESTVNQLLTFMVRDLERERLSKGGMCYGS